MKIFSKIGPQTI